MKQHTLRESCRFSGKSLHTGLISTVEVRPSDAGSGIVFKRVDLQDEPEIVASFRNVSRTDRSTMLSQGGASAGTTEHLMAAFSALGIDNALVAVGSSELPILDGSAKPYVEAFLSAGIVEQDAERVCFSPSETFLYENENGSRIVIEPADEFSLDITVDFGSNVMGVQSAHFGPDVDFVTEIAPCRTFCFYHEIEPLLNLGLIKGGDLDNAIVVVEKDVPGKVKAGYNCNRPLVYDNECARHKLLDVLGDFALLGVPLQARVTAYKPGHMVNADALRHLAQQFNLK